MPEARAWQRMLSGRRLDLLDPSPLDVEIEDIAHGLAFVARWNGQTRGEHPYSVAEHSLLVEQLYARLVPCPEPRWRLAAGPLRPALLLVALVASRHRRRGGRGCRCRGWR